MTTTYTVYNQNSGIEIGRGLSAVQAAQEILSHDSHDYELRRDDETWQLFITRGSNASFGGNGGFTEAYDHRRLIFSTAATEDDAWEEIAEKVINAGWDDVPRAYTDAAYDAMQAETAASP